MKILNAVVYGFGSYEKLEFTFDNQGLCLISGPTGAGKSTLCDIIPWVLFGRTSKDGAVDEVRKWNSPLPTTGTITFELKGKLCKIVRIRGDKQSNDLILTIGNDSLRGKDLPDTQKIINDALGMDLDTYLSGAYFHEFSQSSQFFSLPAKKRREITEQMADLELSSTLTKKLDVYRKDLKADLEESIRIQDKTSSKVENLVEVINTEKARVLTWEVTQEQTIASFEKYKHTFETDKARSVKKIKKAHLEKRVELEYDLAEIEKSIKPDEYFLEQFAILEQRKLVLGAHQCDKCGAPVNNSDHLVLIKAKYDLERNQAENNQNKIQQKRLNSSLTKHLATLEVLVAEELRRSHDYDTQIKIVKNEINPHVSAIKTYTAQQEELKTKLKSIKTDISDISIELSDTELLQDVTKTLRSTIVKRTIIELENNTNKLLAEHFDAEMRVFFDIQEADKLEVVITKDGNTCYYTQLSKGQRQLLKLCFAVSVMDSVSNHNLISFNCIFLDEVFSGLDESLKAKGYSLLQNLALKYSSVFVIDHSTELKSMFNNEYQVSLVNGDSQLGQVK